VKPGDTFEFAAPREPHVVWTTSAAESLVGQTPTLRLPDGGTWPTEVTAAKVAHGDLFITIRVLDPHRGES